MPRMSQAMPLINRFGLGCMRTRGTLALADIERCVGQGADELAMHQRTVELEIAARLAADSGAIQ